MHPPDKAKRAVDDFPMAQKAVPVPIQPVGTKAGREVVHGRPARRRLAELQVGDGAGTGLWSPGLGPGFPGTRSPRGRI